MCRRRATDAVCRLHAASIARAVTMHTLGLLQTATATAAVLKFLPPLQSAAHFNTPKEGLHLWRLLAAFVFADR